MEGKRSHSKRGQKRRLDIPDDKLRKLTRHSKSTPDVATAKDAKEKSVEDDPGGSTNAEKESSPKSDRGSPEPTCAICLGKLENKSFTDSCFHMFCFVCLLEWSKVKAECPLCKQPFKSIVHNVRSYEDYDQYHVPRPEQRDITEQLDRRFRYRTTLTGDHRYVLQHDANVLQQQLDLDLLQRPSRWTGTLTAHSQWRTRRQAATSEFRRRIYQNNLRIMEPRVRRQRDTSPGFYHRNPACTHRLVPWLNRELNALLHNHESHVAFVMELIMGLIMRFPIDSEEFFQHVYPFVGRHTRQFMQELLMFARSPYCMTAYDQHVMYEPQADTVESDSDSSSEHSGGNDSDIVILSPSEFPAESMSRTEGQNRYARPTVNIPPTLFGYPTIFLPEPPAEHRFSFEDLTPFLERVRQELEVETAGITTATSGWDSPTPGPSWFGNSSSSTEPIQIDSSESVSDSEATIPATSPRYDRESESVQSSMLTKTRVRVKKNPHQSQTNEDSSSDSSSSNEWDVEIVGYEKPWLERSPVALVSSGDSDDRSGRKDGNETEIRVKSETKKHKKRKHRTWSDSRSSRSKSSGKPSFGAGSQDGSHSQATSSRSGSPSIEKHSKHYSHHKSHTHAYKHKKFSYGHRESSETYSERHRHRSDKSLLLASASPGSSTSSGTERGSRHISYRCRHRTRSRSSSIEIIEYKERNSKHKKKKKHKKHHKKHKSKKDKHKKKDMARSRDHDVQKILDSDEMVTSSGQERLLSPPQRVQVYTSDEGNKKGQSVIHLPSVVVKIHTGTHKQGSFLAKSSESERSSSSSRGDGDGDKSAKKTFKKHPSGHKKSSNQTRGMNASLDKTSEDACTKNKEDKVGKKSSNEDASSKLHETRVMKHVRNSPKENVPKERPADHFVDASLGRKRYVDLEPDLTDIMDDTIRHVNTSDDTQTSGSSRQSLKADIGFKRTTKVDNSEQPCSVSLLCETENCAFRENSDDELSSKGSQIREEKVTADTQHNYRNKLSILPEKLVDNDECSRNEVENSTSTPGIDGEDSVPVEGTLHKDILDQRYTNGWTNEGMGCPRSDPYLIHNEFHSAEKEITQRASNLCVRNDTTRSKAYQDLNTGREDIWISDLPKERSTARESLDQIKTDLYNTYYTSDKSKWISMSVGSSGVDVGHTPDTVQKKNFVSAEVHDPNHNLRQNCESGGQSYQYHYNRSKDTLSPKHQQSDSQMSKEPSQENSFYLQELESMSRDLYEKLGYYAETPKVVEHSDYEPPPYDSVFSSQVRFNDVRAYPHYNASSSSDKTVDESSSALSPMRSLLMTAGIEQNGKIPENNEESSRSWAEDESSPLAIVYSDASRSVSESPVSQSCQVSNLLTSAHRTSFSGVGVQSTNRVDGIYTEDSLSRDLLDAKLNSTSTGTQLQMSETETDMREENYIQDVSLDSSLASCNETEVQSSQFDIDSDRENDGLSVEDTLICDPTSNDELPYSKPCATPKETETKEEDVDSFKEL